jgi:hypothetical protein
MATVGVVLWALALYLHGPLLGAAPLPGLVR